MNSVCVCSQSGIELDNTYFRQAAPQVKPHICGGRQAQLGMELGMEYAELVFPAQAHRNELRMIQVQLLRDLFDLVVFRD